MADDFPAVFILLSMALVTVLDGKASRRALNQDQNLKVIVSAWAEDNALVLGSLLLFAILAAIMMVTRMIDWYALNPPPPALPAN